MKNGRFRAEHLPFRLLAFDERYQRQVIPARVKALIRRWKIEDVGAITVSVRGRIPYVIDGQHRVRAAMEQGLGDTKILCHVYVGLTVEEEARKFLALNDIRAVSSLDRYRAGLVANDPVCVGVRDTLAAHGLRIGSGDSDGVVRCVGRAVALYERDPRLLDSVAAVLTESWGSRATAFDQVVFAGVGTVVGAYNGELDRRALVRKLSGYRGGPSALAGDARGLADIRPISVTRACAEIVVDSYNKGRRQGALPPL
jgi:hypothetical protein